MQVNTIQEAIKDIKRGKMIIVTDDAMRENEGDLLMAAEFCTPKHVNFMAKHGRGLICIPMKHSRLKSLSIMPMVVDNTDLMNTKFTVSVDSTRCKTGISAYERAKTIKTLIDPKTTPSDLRRPGHIFPLEAVPGGVLSRAGHTEAAVDLAYLAGLTPAGVICEILNENGTMARMSYLKKFAAKHCLKIITIKDLIQYRIEREKLVHKTIVVNLPTSYGDFSLHVYETVLDKFLHLALVKGDIWGKKNVLTRVHSECLTGDIFHSKRCDCGEQLDAAMKLIAERKCGVVLYMRQEGRGIGLLNKLRAYVLQEKGLDTVEANKRLGFAPDLRHYGMGAQILVDLGLTTIHLLTNNPRKIVGLEGYGLKVTKRIPLIMEKNRNNVRYLNTKKYKLGHLL